MGDFSWLYCDMGAIEKETFTNWAGVTHLLPKKHQRLIMGQPASVLFPKEFGGKEKQINEPDYYGYGMFKGRDIYDLVADWNREYFSKHPEWIPPFQKNYYGRTHIGNEPKPISEMEWYPYYADLSLSKEEVAEGWRKEVLKKYGNKDYCITCNYRSIGIHIACYDEDNASLPYPIKIARHPESVYENCPFSYGDPDQGWDLSW